MQEADNVVSTATVIPIPSSAPATSDGDTAVVGESSHHAHPLFRLENGARPLMEGGVTGRTKTAVLVHNGKLNGTLYRMLPLTAGVPRVASGSVIVCGGDGANGRNGDVGYIPPCGSKPHEQVGLPSPKGVGALGGTLTTSSSRLTCDVGGHGGDGQVSFRAFVPTVPTLTAEAGGGAVGSGFAGPSTISGVAAGGIEMEDLEAALEGFSAESLRGAGLFQSSVEWGDVGGLRGVRAELREILEVIFQPRGPQRAS